MHGAKVKIYKNMVPKEMKTLVVRKFEFHDARSL